MGVCGLATFVHSEGGSLLEPYKFCKTTVIIDGNNFIHRLFQRYSESREFIFGGDYDYLHSRVYNIFGLMLKCEINPIILFDGCQPETKRETVEKRRIQKLENLIRLGTGAKSDTINPVLLYEAVVEGLEDIGVKYRRVYEEADPEIAALAEHLKCPVLSGDSDFFLYDVDVIPLREVDFTCAEDEDGSLYFPCHIYRSGGMSRLFPGLERSILPMVDIIVGNSFLGKGFTRVFTGSEDRNFRDIFEVLKTINNRESVITRILQSLDSKEVESVEPAIREVLKCFDIPLTISLYPVNGEIRTTRDAKPSVYGLDLSGLPDELIKLYENCKLDSFVLGLLRYKRYQLSIPIEDINEDSCHFSSIPIIREIYKILRTVMRAPEEITLNLRVKKKLKDKREVCSNQDYIRTAPLRGNVLKGDEDFRCKVFFQSLDLGKIMEGGLLKEFEDGWVLFVTSVVYWLRNQRKLRQPHLRAVLLMALCIYLKSTGDGAEGRRRAGGDPARRFTCLLKCIPSLEFAEFRARFRKAKRSDCDILARCDYFPSIHVFACLQSILQHVLQLNNLLGDLFRGFRVSRFYSGTFLFHLYVLEDKGFAKKVVEDLPHMRRACEFLENFVSNWGLPAKK